MSLIAYNCDYCGKENWDKSCIVNRRTHKFCDRYCFIRFKKNQSEEPQLKAGRIKTKRKSPSKTASILTTNEHKLMDKALRSWV